MIKAKLTLAEQIDRAKDGRSQKWIIDKMNDRLHKDSPLMTEVKFSRKKTGSEDFTAEELEVLSSLLETELTE